MIEEYIQGESLNTFVFHQALSPELIIKLGIQLCDILDYLHHLMPYPILYQDLKPEHIILCGEQLKLIDFGIASFFTGSGKNFQIFGTKDFAAPEALAGLPVSPSADIYSLGKVLAYLVEQSSCHCSSQFLTTIQKATAPSAADRYETVSLLQQDLKLELNSACPFVSHLTKNIAVFGTKHGVGTTHIAISLVSILNKYGYSALYLEKHSSDSLHAMMHAHPSIKESDGICYYEFFRGIPDYGQGIVLSEPTNCIYVKDYGVYQDDITELDPENLNILILSGSEWDFEHTILAGKKFINHDSTILVCNYDQRNAAKKIANLLKTKVYYFPFDTHAFNCTEQKEQLFFHILPFERRKKKLLHFKKRIP